MRVPAKMATTTNDANNLMKRAGLLKRIRYFLQAWLVKISLASMFKVMRIASAAKFKVTLPEYTKRYPVRPMLQHRVFLPPDHVQKQQGGKLPLLISIHGGVCSSLSDPVFLSPFPFL
jgi:hypothetical protein